MRPRLRSVSGLDPVAAIPPLCPAFGARATTAAAASATTPAPPTAPLPSLSPLSPLRPLTWVGALIATGGPATAAAATAAAAAACSALGTAGWGAVAAERLRCRRGRWGGELGRHQLDPRLEIRVHLDDPDLRDVGGRHPWPARTPTEPGAA